MITISPPKRWITSTISSVALSGTFIVKKRWALAQLPDDFG